MGILKKLWRFRQRINCLSNEALIDVVFEIISKNDSFERVILVNEATDIGTDIIAETKSDKYLIEVKSVDLIGSDYIKKISTLKDSVGKAKEDKLNIKLVLCNTGDFSNEAIKLASIIGIELWDYKTLFELDYLKKELNELFRIGPKETQEDLLINRLESISSGKSEWNVYQKCIADIFELLFYPVLGTPKYEISDFDGANRRDIIMENQSESGFWQNIRELYKGDYIVIDAKNYSGRIGKKPVIEIAHYLKPYGCGMFGILTTRKGSDTSAHHAMKEQWIGNNKLIIELNDSDLIEMLSIKKNHGIPEAIIKMKIANFRVKL
ncbi:restriction endonuclease [Paenibacillus xylanexedens]|uniref:restriction endonuclease n=1 Tax=Paenibacillus xylanexedens TaxID=528191 RepID=UPI0011A5CFEE|nr:restriction endonuclease [Paenibacillus xylanexedens]